MWLHHYKCPHKGCSKVLARQYWPLHVELDHIDGRKVFTKNKSSKYKCFECDLVFDSRIKRGQHRTRAHSIVRQKMEDTIKRRDAKAKMKLQMDAIRKAVVQKSRSVKAVKMSPVKSSYFDFKDEVAIETGDLGKIEEIYSRILSRNQPPP